MKCPVCKKPADVLETRTHPEYVRRRYECFNSHRFSTQERVHIFQKGKQCANVTSKHTSSSV